MSEKSEVRKLLVGKGEEQKFLLPGYANRHGLITGATGTGKTVTLQILAEGFSKIGVPVFMADVKGDLSGLSQAAGPHRKITERIEKIGIEDYRSQAYPVVLWDVFGKSGHPIRATVSDMGPLLLTSMMELNETQEGVLNVAFKMADEEGLLLLDFKDLREILRYLSENAKQISAQYGRVTPASVGAIQRRLLVLERQGAEQFFGEPALELTDILRQDLSGKGVINILAADQLISRPRLYSTFLLWLLSELFEELPEIGDPEKPRLVFFFDEAHVLFNTAPKALLEKVNQVVRLIRSKGVGVYFITQNPLDVPDTVSSQLGNRIQHALRAYTPREQKAVKAAASTFRPNPKLDVQKVITTLGVGEGLVSMLEDGGIPGIVDACLIVPPESRIGPATDEERAAVLSRSGMGAKYNRVADRESAFEILRKRVEEKTRASEQQAREAASEKERVKQRKANTKAKPRGRPRKSELEKFRDKTLSTMGSSLGRALTRTILGSLKKYF
ncbi:MAG: DUF853 domain-containing protein [Xanthomonadales bacterium]|nr:DUF853 domain-containing protein [Xanthomonadales bacterium]